MSWGDLHILTAIDSGTTMVEKRRFGEESITYTHPLEAPFAIKPWTGFQTGPHGRLCS